MAVRSYVAMFRKAGIVVVWAESGPAAKAKAAAEMGAAPSWTMLLNRAFVEYAEGLKAAGFRPHDATHMAMALGSCIGRDVVAVARDMGRMPRIKADRRS